MVELVEMRVPVPQNELASSRSHVPFCIPLPHFSPGRRGPGSSKSMGSPLEWCESHFPNRRVQPRRAEHRWLGTQDPLSAGECALYARLTGPRFAAQVAAVVGLVEDPANHYEAAAVAKEIMAIKYSNRPSSKKSSRRPSPANTPSSFQRAPRRRRPRWQWQLPKP